MRLFVIPKIVVGLLLFASQFVIADEVDEIINTKPVPEGVVFEVLSHEPATWPQALSYIKKSIKRLRAKHADMAFAIVSHGMEQFALLEQEKKNNAETHNQVQGLVKDNVKLEVCGTFAGWNGYDKSDFPDYVTVVDQAPQSISFYEEDGFAVIVITESMLAELN